MPTSPVALTIANYQHKKKHHHAPRNKNHRGEGSLTNLHPPKTNMTSWKITIFKDEIHLQMGVFSIVILVFGDGKNISPILPKTKKT